MIFNSPRKNQNQKRTRSFLILLLPLMMVAIAARAEDMPAADKADRLASYDAREVISGMEDLMRSKTNHSRMVMTVINPAWKSPRAYEMLSWDDREGDKSFIRIIAPPRDKGNAFLKIGNVFKMYIPTERENKPITIPPSLMLQPWMGSDFTNDDLVRESSILDDYEQTLEGIEKDENGKDLLRVRLDPKPEAAVVWGKIVVLVRPDDYIPVRQKYYDEDGAEVREMRMSEIKEMGGHKIPTRWEMVSLEEDKKGRSTVLEIKTMEFDVEIDPATFTEKNLTRRDWE